MSNAKVYFIWVGQGDCTLIRSDDDTLVLIDCGTSDSFAIYEDNVKTSIQDVLTETGKTQIDYLILTHSDKDHCNLVNKLFDITSFKTTYYGGTISQYKSYIYDKTTKKPSTKLGLIKDLKPHFLNLYEDTIIDSTDFKMWIIGGNYPYSHDAPDTPFKRDINLYHNTKNTRTIFDNNGNSLMVVINANGFLMMFLGDATNVQQQFIYDKSVEKSVSLSTRLLKMSHHGSPDSFNSDMTNKAVKPLGVSASAGVTFGHPSQQTIDSITTVGKSGLLKHNLVMYDDDEEQYDNYADVNEFIFNTMQKFQESSISVPTLTKSGKRNRDSHSGEPYLEMIGSNWIFEITSSTAATITKGTDAVILTTKGTTAVTSRKKKRRGT
jgi:beta-lactamase superfamily II metal-dependent hydrolase